MRNFLLISTLCLIQIFTNHSPSKAQLSGTLTVDPANSQNYNTLQECVDSLVSKGLDGPVVVQLVPGTYHEQITFDSIPGNSIINTLTFTSSTGNPEDVVLLDTLDDTFALFNYAHIRLNYVDYITFEKLTIKTVFVNGLGASITFYGGNNKVTFRNNILNISGSSTYGLIKPESTDENFESSDYGPDSIELSGNTIQNALLNIYKNEEDDPAISFLVKGNSFENSSISVTEWTSVHITENSFIPVSRNQTSVVLFNLVGDNVIDLNYFYDSSGMFINSEQGEILVANNFFSTANISVTMTGDSIKLVHNNFFIKDGNTGDAPLYFLGGENNLIVNNTFAGTGTTAGLLIGSEIASNTVFDYNNYFTESGVFWKDAVTLDDYLSLEAVQAQYGVEANGQNIDPVYVSDTDLHSLNTSLNGKGTPVPEVVTDIDGESRNPEAPAIGADEIVDPPNLALQSVNIEPTSGVGLVNVTVNWSATNTSNTNYDGPWTDRVYISRDQVLDEGDELLGEVINNDPLAAGATYQGSFAKDIEPELSGDYYFLVRINADQSVAEDEADNIKSSPVFNYAIADRAELVVSLVDVPAAIVSGSTITISWQVTNQGKAATDQEWIDRVYISTDSSYLQSAEKFKPDSGVIASNTNPAGLNPGESYQSSATYNIPLKNTGTFYVKVLADAEDVINEEFEDPINNGLTSSKMVVSQAPLADLRIESIEVPATSFTGDTIQLSYQVRNIGNEVTSNDVRRDYIYLSTDSVSGFNPPNAYLKVVSETYRQEMGPDSSIFINKEFILPKCEAGNLFFFFLVDGSDAIIELSDQNNHFVSNHIEVVNKPSPDFLVQNFNINDANPESGSNLNFSYEILNDGFVEANINNNLYDAIYLSTTETLDISKAVLDLKPIDLDEFVLPVGETFSRTRNLAIPDSVFGDFYLFVLTDNPNEFCEIPFEENNQFRSNQFNIALAPPKDLVASESNMPSSVTAGEKMIISYKLSNNGQGNLATTNLVDSLFLYNETSQYYLTRVKKDRILDAGATVEEEMIVTVPIKMEPGSYQLKIIVDAAKKVYEHEAEENNTLIEGIIEVVRDESKLAELVVDNVTVTSAISGDPHTISYQVTNTSIKSTSRNYWVDKIEIRNKISDRLEIEHTVNHSGALAENENYTSEIVVQIPLGMQGEHELTLLIDEGDGEDEYNEENNVYVQDFNIELTTWPDLEVSNPVYPNTFTAGQPAVINWTISNEGTRIADQAGWADKIYLSKTQSFGSDDIQIFSQLRTTPLETSGTYQVTADFRMPVDVEGQYYLILRTDDKNVVFENNDEGNNTFISTDLVTIDRPLPVDLVPVSSSITLDNMTISYQVDNNSGNDALGSWFDAFYLSTDDHWDVNDKLIAYQKISEENGVAAGSSYTFDGASKLPFIKPGDYYLLVKSDVYNYIPETDDVNNTVASATPYYIDNIATLTAGVATDSTFEESNEQHLYRLEKTSGKGILLTLDGKSASSISDLYYKTGDLPTSGGDFDYRGENPFQPDQRIIVPSSDAPSEDFILAEGDYIDGSQFDYSILAEEKSFSIVDVVPKRGPEAGNVVIDVSGFDFTDSLNVILRNESDTTSAMHSFHINSTLARAHVNTSPLAPGIYDVVLQRLDQEDETILENVFTVEDTSYTDLIVDPVVPEGVRATRDFSVDVNYANLGNMNDYDVLLFVSFYRADFQTDSFDIEYMGDGISENLPVEVQNLHDTGTDVFIQDENAYHFVTWFPVFPANGRGKLKFKLNIHQEDTVWIATRYFAETITNIHFTGDLEDLKTTRFLTDFVLLATNQTTASSSGGRISQVQECVQDPEKVEAMIYKSVRQHAEYVSGGIPGSPTQVATTLITEGLKSYVDPEAHRDPTSMYKDLTDERRDVVLNPTEKSAYDDLIKNLDECLTPDIVNTIKDNCISYEIRTIERTDGRLEDRKVPVYRCPPEPCKVNCGGGGGGGGATPVPARKPKDPNDIIGPIGIGDPKFVTTEETLPYKIRFENVPTATAPAQFVSIDNELEADFDIKRFQLNEIGWGDTTIQLPPKASFNGTFDLGPKYDNNQIRIVAGIDPVNRRAFWTFTTIDPETGARPESALEGFLPPNDSTGIGEGFVSYTIKALSNLNPGTIIENDAVIVFDQENSLATNIWTNTIPGSDVESFVNDLPAETDTTRFEVNWESVVFDDYAPQVAFYSIYVSVDDGDYEVWLENTTETSAIFTGEVGKNYRYFSVATFNDGSYEGAPNQPDAITTLVEKEEEVTSLEEELTAGIKVYPNPSIGDMTIEYRLETSAMVKISIYDLAGQLVLPLLQQRQSPGLKSIQLGPDYRKIRNGMYIVKTEIDDLEISKRWLKID